MMRNLRIRAGVVRGTLAGSRAIPACALVFACFLLAMVTSLRAERSDAAGIIDVDTATGVDSITVGERLRIQYRLTYPEGLTLLPIGSVDTGTCRVVSMVWKDDVDGASRALDMTVMTIDLEAATMPELPFHFLSDSGDTLVAYGDEVVVPVRMLTAESSDARDLKPQWEAPPSYAWAYWVGGGLLAAVLAALLWTKRRRTVIVAPPAPEMPADYVALHSLAQVESMGLVEKREFKRYYTLIVDAVRLYIEGRFAVDALDRTSDELLSELRRIRIPIEGLEPLLREADLVKFAKRVPDGDACRTSLDRARDVVAQTAPRTRVAGE